MTDKSAAGKGKVDDQEHPQETKCDEKSFMVPIPEVDFGLPVEL